MSKQTMKILSDCIPIFSMLQDENRQQLLMLLFDCKEMSVTELTQRLDLSRPAVSHHLKLLLDSGLVEVRKSGKERLYGLNMSNALNQLEALTASIKADMNKAPE